jgi:hypothetical protein
VATGDRDTSSVSTLRERMDTSRMVSAPADETSTPQALVVLARDGVNAYRQFLAARRTRQR